MASLAGKAVVVVGEGTPEHRAVAVALAEAGANVAVAGASGFPSEVHLNSIANEIWAIGQRGVVVTFDAGDSVSYARALEAAVKELGRVHLVVRCEEVKEI